MPPCSPARSPAPASPTALPAQPGQWPWATFVANVAGAFALGYAAASVAAGFAAVMLASGFVRRGDGDRIAAALGALRAVLRRPVATIERVRVCKRDGATLAEPRAPGLGAPAWQKLTVFSSERTMAGERPLSDALIWRLRRAGAAGTTSLRGVWGYHGDHAPHGDVLWQLRRRVPVVSVLVDTPADVARWYPIVDELTAAGGLVTREAVPEAHVRSRATPAA